MTLGYKIPLQCWIGSTDVNGMLMSVGGWHKDSQAATEAYDALTYAVHQGWVVERTHYFPDGDTAPAYELTDAGLQRIEDSYGPKARAAAEKGRRWYRDRIPAGVR